MNSPLKKIAIILLVIFLLPLLFYSGYELNSLNEEEEMIEEIYTNQLDAILYSVNQYSGDVADGWKQKINMILERHPEGFGEELSWDLDEFLQQNLVIQFMFLVDSVTGRDIAFLTADSMFNIEGYNQKVEKLMEGKDKEIKRLYTYKRGGFTKIQPVGDEGFSGNSSSLIFLIEKPYMGYSVCGVVMDAQRFINEILDPRIQTISEEKFIISAYAQNNDSLIYSSESLDGTSDPQAIPQTKEIWLLPNYYLGIFLKGKTIASLVEERSRTSIFLILILNLVLVLGVWLVYRNIKKEIQLAQNKSDFVSNVSHEIRTPLSLISMFAETLEMGRVKSDEKRKEYYTIISKETHRLAGIVNSILNFSKMEANKRNYQFQSTDLNLVVDDILKTYDFHLTNKGFSYSFEPDSGSEVVTADKEAVSEAVINLIDNAVKYSKDDKRIVLKTYQDSGFAIIEVKDFGIGISKENQKEVFDKFFRVGGHLIHNTKGTGLGLSIVKHIMNAHKGKITLESNLDVGSSFKLHFPLENNKKNNKV